MADLNPIDWPTWLKLLAGWGPLAAGWVWAEVRRAREATAHHKTRDGHDTAIEERDAAHSKALAVVHATHEDAVAKIHAHYASALDGKSKEYSDRVRQMADDNRQQMTALFDRCMRLVEQQSTAVAELLDAFKRRRQ